MSNRTAETDLDQTAEPGIDLTAETDIDIAIRIAGTAKSAEGYS
jgi:hypothetical protein